MVLLFPLDLRLLDPQLVLLVQLDLVLLLDLVLQQALSVPVLQPVHVGLEHLLLLVVLGDQPVLLVPMVPVVLVILYDLRGLVVQLHRLGLFLLDFRGHLAVH